MELDSHADTTCAGANCVVIEYTGQVVDVTPYNSAKYEPETNIPIVKAATAYTDSTGTTYILVVNQALYFPELTHSLLNPNQARTNGVIVEDCPKHLSHPDKPSSHSIYFPTEQVRIPLEMGGVISKFPTHVPTSIELVECQWLTLTADSIWDPHSSDFAENERILHERHLDCMQHERSIYSLSQFCTKPDAFIDDPVTRNLSAITSSLTITGLHEQIKEQRTIAGINSGSTRGEITQERLARLWNIPLKTAAQTIHATTQRGIRMAVHPLHARYRTKQAQLRYNQLGGWKHLRPDLC